MNTIRQLYKMIDKCTGWNEAHKMTCFVCIRILSGMKDKEPSRELQIHNDITLEQIKQQLKTIEIIIQSQTSEIDDEQTLLGATQQPVKQQTKNK